MSSQFSSAENYYLARVEGRRDPTLSSSGMAASECDCVQCCCFFVSFFKFSNVDCVRLSFYGVPGFVARRFFLFFDLKRESFSSSSSGLGPVPHRHFASRYFLVFFVPSRRGCPAGSVDYSENRSVIDCESY